MDIIYKLLLLLDKLIGNINDSLYLKAKFKLTMKKKLNLNNPQTFNEKLQWLKLYDKNPEYTKMVDKYQVKEYVGNIIGWEYIIPTLGVWNKFEDINFEKLPNQFVLKCTHDSGGIIIVKDKLSINLLESQKKINKCLKRNYYYAGREWPYKNVKPRIIAEIYLNDFNSGELMDYKFFCFNGKVKFLKVDFNRFIEHHANYYDTKLNILPFGERICPPDLNKKIDFPENINKMIELAEKLAKDIPFVRIDFYNVNEKIYFGEMTFYPAAGFGKIEPEEWDLKIGEMLELPNQKIEEKNEK